MICKVATRTIKSVGGDEMLITDVAFWIYGYDIVIVFPLLL
jgi:hypothetical protein